MEGGAGGTQQNGVYTLLQIPMKNSKNTPTEIGLHNSQAIRRGDHCFYEENFELKKIKWGGRTGGVPDVQLAGHLGSGSFGGTTVRTELNRPRGTCRL